MRRLDLNELRVETFEPAAREPAFRRGAFTEQQYCTIGNPPLDELDHASRTTCPICCV